MRYAIKNKETGEYLREGFDFDDAYTDDLGQALLFYSDPTGQVELIETDVIVPISEDVDGGFMEADSK